MLGRTADALIARFGWWNALRLLWQLQGARVRARGSRVEVNVPDLPFPVTLRARTTDASTLRQILRENRFAGSLPDSARFIIDAGANIGLATAYLATRYPSGRVVALEIEPGNVAMLRHNMRGYPNVSVVHAGLWSRTTRLAVQSPSGAEWAFQAAERHAADATEDVPGLTVSDVMVQFGATHVDILKVDIEGAEREVFGPTAEEWLDRVRLIAVELHDAFLPGCEAIVAGRLGTRFKRSRVGEYDVFERISRDG